MGMNRRTRWLGAGAACATMVLFSGCKTVSTSSHPYLGGTSYPPTDPAQVVILREQPAAPHVNVGEVQAQPSSSRVGNPQIEQALRKQAAKMGANAVVVVADRDQIVGATLTGPAWARSVNPISGRVITGIAIRYTQSSGNSQTNKP